MATKIIQGGIIVGAIGAGLIAAYPAQSAEIPAKFEVAFAAVELADMMTTADIKHHKGCAELNPLLGKHPSDARVFGYGAAMIAEHVAITYALVANNAPTWIVRTWEYTTIGYEAAVVGRNYSLGYRFKF